MNVLSTLQPNRRDINNIDRGLAVRTIGDMELDAGAGRGLGNPEVAVLLLPCLEEQHTAASL